ncbi:hypothetical protein B6A27_11340 [Anoxybacillus sp. UARK-01]|nr:hypothetical protein B6A27_11340 [Anoxybacillus sp. UARK-01]
MHDVPIVEPRPQVMQKIFNFVPLASVVDLMQGGWTGKLFVSDLLFDFIFLAVLYVGSILIGTKYFRWQEQKNP